MVNWSEEEYEEYQKTRKKEPVKKSKYRNKKVYFNKYTFQMISKEEFIAKGIVKADEWNLFDSIAECNYYRELLQLEKTGDIKHIELQPVFELQPSFKKNGKTIRAIRYIADFKVFYKDGTVEIIDVKASKSFKTEKYKLKKKMFEYKYPLMTIKEVYNR